MGTRLTDIIVPEVFNGYMMEATTKKSRLYQSGIVQDDPQLNSLAGEGGRLINMPFWGDLDGEDEIIKEDTEPDIGKIQAKKDVAVRHMRRRVWGSSDLSAELAGDDPLERIAARVADYWARRWQRLMLASLEGVFKDDSMENNLLDVSEETDGYFEPDTFIDATHKLGDEETELTAMAVHSDTLASMKKQDLIEYVKPSDDSLAEVPTYQGREIIVDDSMPREDVEGEKVYTTYIFGTGAFGLGEAEAKVETETDRDALKGNEYLINRRHFILHPRGIKFTDNSVEDDAPTNTELEMAENWERVYEPKNVRIVAFIHKLKENS